MSTSRSDIVSAAQLLGMSCVVALSVFWGCSASEGLRRLPLVSESDEDFGEKAAGLVAAGTALTVGQTGEFGNQVAGHVKQPIRTLQGSVLKPLNRRLHFLRELLFYHQIAHEFGVHWTQSAKQFVPRLTGWYHCESDRTPSSIAAAEEKRQKKKVMETGKGEGEKKGQVQGQMRPVLRLDKHGTPVKAAADALDAFLLTHQMYLGLEDLTAAHARSCAIDIKMGTQTYEPAAEASKRQREVRKCPHQAEVGFRITGFQAYDSRCDELGTVSKHFGRRLHPDAVYEALALFFFDGVRLRRDAVLATIQELEKLLLWFRSQSQVHFYCSSLLITYDAWCGREYSEKHYRRGTPHFLQCLGPQFPSPHPELPDEQVADTDDGAVAGVLLEEDSQSHSDMEAAKPAASLSLSPQRVKIVVPPLDLELPHQVGERLRPRQTPPPPSGGVKVKMIDFAHALPGQSSLDLGYIHGLQSLVTRLHGVLSDADVTRSLLVERAKYDRHAAGVRSAPVE